MQLVNGESLEQRLKRVGKLTRARRSRELGMQAAAGLAAAHAGGLIHRDIKPANILLEAPADRVKLTDFGLARAAEDVKLTRTGFVAGSPLYMAPEQARGDEVDHRADLFSLGSVLYEAATGTAPFEARRRSRSCAAWPTRRRSRCTAVNPDVPDVAVRRSSTGCWRRTRPTATRRRARWPRCSRRNSPRWHALSPLDVPAEVCPRGVGLASTVAPARKHDLLEGGRVPRCAVGRRRGARRRWRSGSLWSPGAVEKTVEVPVPSTPDGAGGVGPVARPGPEVRVRRASPERCGPSRSSTDERSSSGMDDGDVKIWNFRTDAIEKTLEPRQGGTIWSADVSADGKYLVTACDDSDVTVWNLETTHALSSRSRSRPRPRRRCSARTARRSPPATGTRRSGSGTRGTDPGRAPAATAARSTRWPTAPTAQRLASAGSDGTVKVWDLTEINWSRREQRREVDEPRPSTRGRCTASTFSPDGKLVATPGGTAPCASGTPRPGPELRTIKAHDGDAWSVSFGNGGKWVASAGRTG